MTIATDDRLDRTFAALADSTRRAILARLAEGEATVTELAAPFAMTMPAVSKHLKVLQRAGLISRGRKRQWRPARLEPQPLMEVAAYFFDNNIQPLFSQFLGEKKGHFSCNSKNCLNLPRFSGGKNKRQVH